MWSNIGFNMSRGGSRSVIIKTEKLALILKLIMHVYCVYLFNDCMNTLSAIIHILN